MSTKPLFGGKSPKALPWTPLPLMEEWLENLALDDKSQGYINAARVGLAHFATYCQTEGIKHPDEVQRHHVLRFQAFLTDVKKENGENLATSYRQQIMKYVRSWVMWLVELEHVEVNPWVRIRIGRTPKVPKPLEDDEIAQLFSAHQKMAFSISPFYFHRREVILALLYGWGLRIHELAALTVDNMDMRLDFVTARNKGGGTKQLPYSDEIKMVIQRYLIQRGRFAKTPGVDALLIDNQGRPMSTALIYKVVTELGQRAGVTINPHRLRDSFGTKMLEEGVEVERIMKMMGHTQRSQTLAYARVADKTLKTSHDAVMDPLLGKLLRSREAQEANNK